jgi:hypothetical protein
MNDNVIKTHSLNGWPREDDMHGDISCVDAYYLKKKFLNEVH